MILPEMCAGKPVTEALCFVNASGPEREEKGGGLWGGRWIHRRAGDCTQAATLSRCRSFSQRAARYFQQTVMRVKRQKVRHLCACRQRADFGRLRRHGDASGSGPGLFLELTGASLFLVG